MSPVIMAEIELSVDDPLYDRLAQVILEAKPGSIEAPSDASPEALTDADMAVAAVWLSAAAVALAARSGFPLVTIKDPLAEVHRGNCSRCRAGEGH